MCRALLDGATLSLGDQTTVYGVELPCECLEDASDEGPFMAGKRPLAGQSFSDFGLFCHFEGVIYLDTEVANSALKLGMAEQQLHRPKVLRSPINQ